jgi:pantothenate kinase
MWKTQVGINRLGKRKGSKGTKKRAEKSKYRMRKNRNNTKYMINKKQKNIRITVLNRQEENILQILVTP